MQHHLWTKNWEIFQQKNCKNKTCFNEETPTHKNHVRQLDAFVLDGFVIISGSKIWVVNVINVVNVIHVVEVGNVINVVNVIHVVDVLHAWTQSISVHFKF